MIKQVTMVGAGLLLSVGAHAAQITFGPSAQPVTFTPLPGGGVSVSAVAPQLDIYQATDTTSTTVGGAWFLGLDFTTGAPTGGLYPANPNTGTFKYINGNDELVEQISATLVQDDTTQPKVFGTGITTSIQGDAAFLAAFGLAGTHDAWDFIVNDIGARLDQLTGPAGATISAGEKLPSPVSEPSTLAALGAMMVTFGLLRWRWRGKLDAAV